MSPRLALLVLCSSAFAQVTPTAVTDAASFSSRVAPGSLATIFGTGITATQASATLIPLPLVLGGVQVTVDGIPAPLVYVGVAPYNQINFQMPSGVQPGTANLIVTLNNVSSDPFPVYITDTAPGIFSYDPTGGTLDPTLLQAVIQNPPDYNNNNINSPSNPAPAGSVVVVYMNGTGAVQTPVADGSAAGSADPAVAVSSATIAGFDAPVAYLGLTPGSVGLGQANVQIPSGLPSGNYPLILNVGGLQSISTVISVSGSGTIPVFLQEVALFNNFAVSERTTLQALNNTLYLCGKVLVRVFDVSTPANALFLGQTDSALLDSRQISCTVNSTVTSPYLVSIVGPGTTPSLTVFDVSGGNIHTPTPIVQGASLNGYEYVQRFVFDGNIGIANSSWIDGSGVKHGDILAFDFTNPADPIFISALPSSNNTIQLKPFIRAATTAAHTVYAVTGTAHGNVASGTGALDVIDITNPQALALVTEVLAPGPAILDSFAVSGTTLLAAGNTSDQGSFVPPNVEFPGNLTLTTMDVSNPLNPATITSVDTGIPSSGSLRTIDISNGGGIFLVQYQYPFSDPNGPNSIAVVDARDASNPLLYPQSTYYYFDGAATVGNYVFAATGNGLNIYQTLVH